MFPKSAIGKILGTFVVAISAAALFITGLGKAFTPGPLIMITAFDFVSFKIHRYHSHNNRGHVLHQLTLKRRRCKCLALTRTLGLVGSTLGFRAAVANLKRVHEAFKVERAFSLNIEH